ncbi:MAG: OmpA family protein [Gammaproteobacteria bacterium]|nr:OmpA family protein [Gammaproteobacteria bacterium]
MDFRFSQFEILTATGALFLCLVFVCVFSEASDIEDDLGTRVTDEVRKQDLFWTSVEAQGQSIVLTGAAPDYRAQQQAGEIAEAVWGVTDVANEIAIIGQAGTCQQEIDDLLKSERVAFKTGRAELDESSYPMLAMVASIARACETNLEIAGHTDSVGHAAINQKLSQRRADAVRKYLVQSGVNPGRLKANGYGETQPVADNGSESGRKANRRIEFRVLGGTA